MIKEIVLYFKKADGVTSIEYALMAGLIAMVIVFAVTGLGGVVQGLYQAIADSFPN